MNTGKFNNWLQIAANLGILIGLILVGFQMRQNSELLGAEPAGAEERSKLVDPMVERAAERFESRLHEIRGSIVISDGKSPDE